MMFCRLEIIIKGEKLNMHQIKKVKEGRKRGKGDIMGENPAASAESILVGCCRKLWKQRNFK
jgi:hypothetical protein